MDWKNIKTIFIFTFLILNIYLGIEVFEKINPDLQKLAEEQITEDRLDHIKYNKTLPIIKQPLASISGSSKKFTEEDKKEFLKENSNQKIDIKSETIINATLVEPYPLSLESEDGIKGQLETFLGNYIPMSDDFLYLKHDAGRNLYIFQQKYSDVPIHFNEYINEGNLTGLIEILTNKDGDIASYRLTYLEIEEEGEKRKVIPARDALLVPKFPPGTNLKNIELIYFTLIPNEEQFQLKMFVPSWRIVTANQEIIVDATDSRIIKIETTEESEVE
ncbi:two-component system regulatory protein YycI [Alkalihalobacillus sp. AL-G]|uniref:two-component system regulatory protein YycI n=1 Tax=Alkalihalobacillus sp. AL-G TaxID=2926399 RepID=UPI00272CEC92|nr:two-component system regulatory protein YycI [Alkalihalobacillus sp. AL-G]WLD93365.1 two-component system regulatory protein YycI [Alkalihalobacillus sp. AL-G]